MEWTLDDNGVILVTNVTDDGDDDGDDNTLPLTHSQPPTNSSAPYGQLPAKSQAPHLRRVCEKPLQRYANSVMKKNVSVF